MKKIFTEIDDGLDFSIKHIESGETFYDCESVVDILNELAEENQQLRQILDIGKTNAKDIVDVLNIQQSRIKELSEENKELKKQMNRLYNYFMDWYSDEMGANQFSEMWGMVKEDERWDCE